MAQVKRNLTEMAAEILEIAERHGVEQNYFFITTFKRYQVQIKILIHLEQAIAEQGTLVTKEYVKGRGNVYTHPAITEYNRTSTAANQTVQTLVRIVKELRTDEDTEPDELLEFLRSGKK